MTWVHINVKHCTLAKWDVEIDISSYFIKSQNFLRASFSTITKPLKQTTNTKKRQKNAQICFQFHFS